MFGGSEGLEEKPKIWYTSVMTLKRRNARLLTLASGLLVFLWPLIASADIQLLQPIGGLTSIPTTGKPFDVFLSYINELLPWAEGVAAGIAVVWGLWGMTGVIMSGGDQSKRSASIKQVQAACLGLLLLLLVGVILHTINASFFKVG